MTTTIHNLFGQEVAKPLARGEKGTGCAYCPSNSVPGIFKIKGLNNIRRKRIFVWPMCPGKKENEKRLALVGPAGQFLWDTFKELGITRSDCDIQNVVRCMTLDEDGHYRDPSKEELRCCSVYSEQAIELNQGAAQVYLILGEVAGKQLLGKKLYRKDTPIFWHQGWNAYVVNAAHPSYILRCGGKKAGWIYKEFRDRLRAVKTIADNPGRWGYIQNQNYGAIETVEELDELLIFLYSEAKEGRPISVDLEDGEVDGKSHVPLMIGLGWGHYENGIWEGGARSVLLEHPEFKNKHLAKFKQRLAKLMEDVAVPKGFQHGSFDVPSIEEYLHCKVRGYDRDSQYVAYLYDSNRRSYSFESIVKYWFLEFADYKKTIVGEWKNFAEAPLEKLVPYNCADCDLTLRVCDRFLPKISYPLLQVYIADAFVLDAMEKRGPLLDWQEHARLKEAIPRMREPITQKLRTIAEDSEFNPGAPPQVAKLLYDKLGLPKSINKDGKPSRSTEADILLRLSQEYEDPTPKLMLEWRALSVSENTFLDGWARSAEEHDGELRTKWWLTGAATGRLRSGKSGDESDEALVNLQNTHSTPLMQNLLISDAEWRKALDSDKDLGDLWVCLAGDYSGIEVRLMCEASGDALLIHQFNSGMDIHSQVGNKLTGIPVEKILNDKPTRTKIKQFVFGLLYGLGPENGPAHMTAQGAPITKQEFVRFQKRFFQEYSGVKRFIDKCHRDVETTGAVTGIFGFRRRLPKVDAKRSSYYLNQAINTPIQNGAHQLVLIAMALLFLKPKVYAVLQNLIMEVHDELVFRVQLKHLLEADTLLRNLLQIDVPNFIETHFKRKFRIPLVAEVEAGFTRGSMVTYEKPIPSLKQFLADWRVKYKKVAATPLTDLMKVD